MPSTLYVEVLIVWTERFFEEILGAVGAKKQVSSVAANTFSTREKIAHSCLRKLWFKSIVVFHCYAY